MKEGLIQDELYKSLGKPTGCSSEQAKEKTHYHFEGKIYHDCLENTSIFMLCGVRQT